MSELKNVPLFAKASAAELAAIEKIAHREHFPADTVLFFEQDRGDALYVIQKGAVKVYKTHDDGQEKILATLGAGELVGELSILDSERRSASVATIEPTDVVSIRRQEFRQLAVEQPDLLWHVVEALCGRIRRASEKTVAMAFEGIPFRVVSTLVRLCASQSPVEHEGRQVWRVAANDVSRAAGTDAPSTERVLRVLVKKNLVAFDADHLVVADLYSLTRAQEYAREWT